MGPVGIHRQNKDLLRRLVEAMNSRRLDLLDEIVAPGLRRHCQATPGLEVRSLAEFKEFQRQDATIFPDSVQTIRHIIAEGDLVAAWGTYQGTQMGPMGPFPPSRKKMSLDFAVVLRVEDEKIAELWITWDNMAALTQLGHLPALPSETG